MSGTILVVDDHVDLAENIAEILGLAGYTTDVATSAEAALERLRRGNVTALITDFRLPGLSGAELITEMRRAGISIPAIVMSAYTDEQTIGTSHEAGAADVLPKPLDVTRLLALVDEFQGAPLVLVVDDNRELAENFAEALRLRGYDVRIGASSAEALGQALPIRAAVIDYRLPDGSGVDLAATLAARRPGLNVLFITGHADELRASLRRTSLAHSDALEKPVPVDRLLSWVARAVGDGPTKRSDR